MAKARVTSPPLLFAVVSCCLVSSAYPSSGVGCRDNSGKPVDWFVVYKLPRLNSTNALVSRGVGQVYLDPLNQKKWNLLERGIDASEHAVAKTLQQIYTRQGKEDGDNRETPAYLLYNDRTPTQKNYTSKYGHTKGALAFDRTSGFWMVHSVPGFPPSPRDSAAASYGYPPSGMKYGQVFLCVSLNYKHFNKIGELLQYNYPQVYDFHLPQELAKENPELVIVAKMIHVTKQSWKIISRVTSLDGKGFIVFAKTSKFRKDLYHDLVAPYLNNDLLVETWQNPPGEPLPSNCSAGQPKVFNVREMEILDFGFQNPLDHSKWATTMKRTTHGGDWVCIGDINRMETQKRRGGGTVCGKLPLAARAFRSSVVKREECKSETEFVQKNSPDGQRRRGL